MSYVRYSPWKLRKIRLLPQHMSQTLQMGGAVLASALVYGSVGSPLKHSNLGSNELAHEVSSAQGILFETVTTYMLVMTVLQCAELKTDVDATQNMGRFTPLAVGLAVTACHLLSVPFTGTGINPARSFGPALISDTWDDHWVFWVGPGLGALLAALTYFFLNMSLQRFAVIGYRQQLQHTERPQSERELQDR